MQRSVYILIMLLFVGNYAAWGNPVNFASTRYGLTFRLIQLIKMKELVLICLLKNLLI